jgi:hypothetical protein
MFILVVLVSGLSAVAAYFVPHPSEKVQSNNCASLKNGENYTIGTNLVQAGALSIQNLTGVNNATFCRVLGQIPYGNNNTINFEVWLPETSEYNGRYLSVGACETPLEMLQLADTSTQAMVALQAPLTTTAC